MPPLGTTGRFVGEDTESLEFIIGNRVGDRLKRTGVVGAGNPVTAVGTSIEVGSEVHCSDATVFFHPGPNPHQDRMPSTMTIKNLFPGQRDFDRSSGQHRQFADHDFMGKRIRFPTKTSTYRAGDDPDLAGRKFQHLRQGTMNIMGSLGRGPEGHPTIGPALSDGRMLLHRHVGVAFIMKDVLTDMIGLRKPFFHVTEFQGHKFVDVPLISVFVNLSIGFGQAFLNRHHRRKWLILDPDVLQGSLRGFLIQGGHRCDRIPNHPDFFNAKRLFILADGKDSVGNRKIFARDHGQHAFAL